MPVQQKAIEPVRNKTAAVAKPEATNPTGDRKAVSAIAPSHVHQGNSILLGDIRLRAFKLWEAAGKPDGDGAKFWLEAERELLAAK